MANNITMARPVLERKINPWPEIQEHLSADSKNVIFLDVFDTVIWRKCLFPTDVFLYLSEAHRYGHSANFYRKACELIAHKIFRNPTFDDVFRFFFAWSIDDEMATECSVVELNPSFLPLINNERLLQRVTFLSDMYMSGGQISRLLQQVGIENGKVISSSDINASKFDGKAFYKVLNSMNLNPKHVMHIGDNEISDGVRPREHGIKSFLLHSPRTFSKPGNQRQLKRSWEFALQEGGRVNKCLELAILHGNDLLNVIR